MATTTVPLEPNVVAFLRSPKKMSSTASGLVPTPENLCDLQCC